MHQPPNCCKSPWDFAADKIRNFCTGKLQQRRPCNNVAESPAMSRQLLGAGLAVVATPCAAFSPGIFAGHFPLRPAPSPNPSARLSHPRPNGRPAHRSATCEVRAQCDGGEQPMSAVGRLVAQVLLAVVVVLAPAAPIFGEDTAGVERTVNLAHSGRSGASSTVSLCAGPGVVGRVCGLCIHCLHRQGYLRPMWSPS